MTIEEIEAEWENLCHHMDKQPWNLDLPKWAGKFMRIYFDHLLAIASAAKNATEGKSFFGDAAVPMRDLKMAVEELEKA